MSGDNGKAVQAIIMLFGGGAALVHKGFKALKRAHSFSDIPTSNISTAPMGDRIEIKAKVLGENHIKAPVSGKRCQAFVVRVYEHQGGKRGYRLEKTIYSERFLEVTDDGQVHAVIDLPNCEFDDWGKKYKFHDHQANKISFGLRRLMKDFLNVKFSNNWFSLARRFYAQEIVFSQNRNVYAIGSACSVYDLNEKQEFKNTSFCDHRQLKENIQGEFKMASGDVLGHQYSTVEVPRFALTASTNKKDFINTSMVFFSFKREKRLVRKSYQKGYLKIVLGAMMMIASFVLAYLLFL